MKIKFLSFLLAFAGIASAQTFTYDLESGYQNWIADFADYPVGDSANWHFNHYHQIMPNSIPTQYGIKLKGDNFSDDLFFWVKRKVTGLTPNTQYSIVFSLDIITNTPPNYIGGSDLMLKAGATTVEPQKHPINGYYRMNINKGNQSTPGPDMDTLGHVNHNVVDSLKYYVVNFSNSKPFKITSDSNGEIWVIIGAESQFETPAEFLIAQIVFNISKHTGVDELSNSFNVSFVPNPFVYATTLQSNSDFTNATLIIYNSFGQEIKQIKNLYGKAIILHRDSLLSGLYFIRITQGNRVIATDKLVITN